MRNFNSIVQRVLALVAFVLVGMQVGKASVCEPLAHAAPPDVPLREWFRLTDGSPDAVTTASWLPGDDILAVRYRDGNLRLIDLTKAEPVVLEPVSSRDSRYGLMRMASTGEFIEARGDELIRYRPQSLDLVERSSFTLPRTKHTKYVFRVAGRPERVLALLQGYGTGSQAVLGMAFSLDGKPEATWSAVPQEFVAAGIAPGGEYILRTAHASNARKHVIVSSFHPGTNLHRIQNAPFTIAIVSIERDQATWPPEVRRIDLKGDWKGFGDVVTSAGDRFLLGAAPANEVSDYKVADVIWPVGFVNSTLWTGDGRGNYTHETVHFKAMPNHFRARNGYAGKHLSDEDKRIYVLSYETDRIGTTMGYGAITAYAFDGSLAEHCEFRVSASPEMSASARFVAIVNSGGVTVYKVGIR